MGQEIRALFIDESEKHADEILSRLRLNGLDPSFKIAKTPEEFEALLNKHKWDFIICGTLPSGFSHLTVPSFLKEARLDIPHIMLNDGTRGTSSLTGAYTDDWILVSDSDKKLAGAIEQELAKDIGPITAGRMDGKRSGLLYPVFRYMRPKRYLPVILVMVIITIFAVSGTITAWNRDIQIKRSDMLTSIEHNLEDPMKTFDASMADTASLGDFLHANHFLTTDGTVTEYDRFSDELDLLYTSIARRYPAVKQIMTIPKVGQQDRKSFEELWRMNIRPDFQITTMTADGKTGRAPDTDEYYPILGISPHSKYEQLLGLNLKSDPVIAKAMDSARDTGKPVLSDRINKIYTGLDDYCYMVISPVYFTSGVPASISQKRRDIIGFSIETQMLSDFFNDASIPLAAEGLDTYVFDIVPNTTPSLIYSYPKVTTGSSMKQLSGSFDREFIFTRTVDLNNRTWKIYVIPSSTSFKYPEPSVWFPAILGAFFLLMLSIYLITSVRRTLQLERTQHALTHAYSELSVLADKAEERTQVISMLSEMAEDLQACLNTDEAFQTISKFLPELFAKTSGSLYIISDPKGPAFAIVDWGDDPPVERAFSFDDCLARRRGKMYAVDDTRHELICTHVKESPPGSYLCVPMIAQGKAIGLLHICTEPVQKREFVQPLTTIQKELSATVAEHIAMAITNIELRDQLREQSISDPLTRLFNRRFIDDTLNREIRRATRSKTKLSVIMMDIDFFKKFNDDYGHDAGDIILKTLAHFLKASIRMEDFACRYGGEEFLLILPGASLENARKRAEQLREDVRFLTVEHEGQVLGPIAVSAGVATFPDNADNKDALVTASDEALYQAKTSGRNRVVTAAKSKSKKRR
jgi:diguanylate cyclase (GGDEF)-like protein